MKGRLTARIAFAAFAALPCLVAAAGDFLSAGPLAAPEFADTEASTNAPLDFGLGENLPLWLFSREWNAFRLDVRGADRPDERFRAAAEVAGAFLKIR